MADDGLSDVSWFWLIVIFIIVCVVAIARSAVHMFIRYWPWFVFAAAIGVLLL